MPWSLDFADLHEAMERAVKEIARVEKRPVSAVLRDLLQPRSDVLRFAVEGRGTDDGGIALDEGLPAPSQFVGHVEALLGEPGDDGAMRGEIVLAAQVEDEIVKMRVELDHADYTKAWHAHFHHEYVSVRGILRRGAQSHRQEDAADFSVVQG